MDKRQFYIDTADTGAINDIIAFLHRQDMNNLGHLRGITTNPNAMSKVGAKTFGDWRAQVHSLSTMLDAWAQTYPDNPQTYELHVQLPNTLIITPEQAEAFIDMILADITSNHVRLGIKIAPTMLRWLASLRSKFPHVMFNVTGLADYASVLRSASFGVNYASIIPGRMEERGIDAVKHLMFLNTCNLRTTKVITGSMRTLRGLSDAFHYNTLPTIGTRVWEQIILQNIDFQTDFINPDAEVRAKYNPDVRLVRTDVPVLIGDESVNLTTEFFEEMNGLGVWAYTGLLNVINTPVEYEDVEDE